MKGIIKVAIGHPGSVRVGNTADPEGTRVSAGNPRDKAGDLVGMLADKSLQGWYDLELTVEGEERLHEVLLGVEAPSGISLQKGGTGRKALTRDLILTNHSMYSSLPLWRYLNWLAPHDFADRSRKRVASRRCIKVED